MKILLNNCTLGNHKKVNILIEDNFFSQISSDSIRVQSDLTFDMSRKLVLPGIIDLNQSLFQSLDSIEKIQNESKAFLKGGITSIINLESNVNVKNSYDIDSISKLSLINYGETSVISFFDDYDDKRGYLSNVLSIGKIEINEDNHEQIKWMKTRILEIQNQSNLLFISMKDEGLDIFLKYLPKNEYRICFYDFNKPSEIERILNFKREGFNFKIAFDVNLFFIHKDMIKNMVDHRRLTTTSGYCNSHEVQYFIDALKKEKIDIVYSNHSPNMLWEKYELNKIGLPSAETILPLMLELATYSNVGIKTIWKVLCENPSNIFNIAHRGKIEVGSYADLVIVDLEKFWFISNHDIISIAKWTPHEGRRVWGLPIITFVNGNIVYDIYDGMRFLNEEYLSLPIQAKE